jgi:hypothetical protein
MEALKPHPDPSRGPGAPWVEECLAKIEFSRRAFSQPYDCYQANNEEQNWQSACNSPATCFRIRRMQILYFCRFLHDPFFRPMLDQRAIVRNGWTESTHFCLFTIIWSSIRTQQRELVQFKW